MTLSRGLGDAHAFSAQATPPGRCLPCAHGFNLALVADLHQQTVHLGAAYFLVRHFAPAMKNHRSHFVAFAEEPDDLVLADLIVVFGGGRTKLYFPSTASRGCSCAARGPFCLPGRDICRSR